MTIQARLDYQWIAIATDNMLFLDPTWTHQERVSISAVEATALIFSEFFHCLSLASCCTGWVMRPSHGLALLARPALIAIQRIQLNQVRIRKLIQPLGIGEQFNAADSFPDKGLQPFGIACSQKSIDRNQVLGGELCLFP
ncbi:MAG TPA: hypothetical protein VLY23_04660 [Candidatus Acidoferrum sp.]|nr:hypothetical protein [Candidatus Acidoferrum sp.]